jgi:urea transport system permease protein
MLQLFQSIFDGISISSVLLIAALGLAIVFGLMGVINLAHGELMMFGAYTTFVVQNIFHFLGEPWFQAYIIFAIPCAFLVSGFIGFLLERGVIRYLYGRPLETLLATWGVSLIFRQFVRSVNSALMLGIILFCLLFFGAIFILRKQGNWFNIRAKIIAILLPISLGIATITGIIFNQSKQPFFTQLWFSARNVDLTAPTWLRGGIRIGGDYAFVL